MPPHTLSVSALQTSDRGISRCTISLFGEHDVWVCYTNTLKQLAKKTILSRVLTKTIEIETRVNHGLAACIFSHNGIQPIGILLSRSLLINLCFEIIMGPVLTQNSGVKLSEHAIVCIPVSCHVPNQFQNQAVFIKKYLAASQEFRRSNELKLMYNQNIERLKNTQCVTVKNHE